MFVLFQAWKWNLELYSFYCKPLLKPETTGEGTLNTSKPVTTEVRLNIELLTYRIL